MNGYVVILETYRKKQKTMNYKKWRKILLELNMKKI